ncbi:MAG TPA: sensor histidine kinase [Gaiellaceae bacterium]|nr:sensor histidine kinase [Gaiellaceae bacterium]
MSALRLGAIPAAVALGVLSYSAGVNGAIPQTAPEAALAVALGWLYVGAGLLAWWKRPQSRTGLLMTLFGLTIVFRNFVFDDSSLGFTVGFLLSLVPLAILAHLILGYPAGHLAGRLERWYMGATYTLVLAFPLAALLFYEPSLYDERTPLGCDPSRGECPASLLLVEGNATAVELARGSLDTLVYLALAVTFVVLLARRLVRATPRTRRMAAPVFAIALVLAVDVIATTALNVRAYTESQLHTVFRALLQFAIPIALLAGVLRERLAHAAVGDLVLELEGKPPHGVHGALARALGDPTLRVAFWLPERVAYVDAAGEPVSLPADTSDQAVTALESDGEPLAALIHDPILLEDPGLVAAAGAAAKLALENERLHAQLRAQLVEVRRSRARIVATADAERRRIERDLHDGAQQRLVALGLTLKLVEQNRALDPEAARLLATAVQELQAAIHELRELARGVHPAILTEEGLGAALESLASRTPLPVTITAAPPGRLAPDVEAAAYFVACEGVTNAVRYSHASAVTIRAERDNGRLVVEVADDGVGGAQVASGSGLRGLADRVEAHGGRLSVESPPEGGTRLVGEIPCAS